MLYTLVSLKIKRACVAAKTLYVTVDSSTSLIRARFNHYLRKVSDCTHIFLEEMWIARVLNITERQQNQGEISFFKQDAALDGSSSRKCKPFAAPAFITLPVGPEFLHAYAPYLNKALQKQTEAIGVDAFF